jgi:hypothetical protein
MDFKVMREAFQDELQKIKLAGELQGFVRGGRRPISVDRLLERERESGQEVSVMEKIAETEKERARRYGSNGAKIYSGMTAANMLLNPEARSIVRQAPGVVPAALGVTAALGYGGGRLVHRIAHGPATDKKVKKAGARTALFGTGALTGAAGYHVTRRANEDRKLGKMMRLQQGQGQ